MSSSSHIYLNILTQTNVQALKHQHIKHTMHAQYTGKIQKCTYITVTFVPNV
jgi:hypothetical protein